MNSHQIAQLLPNIIGVYSSDTLPKKCRGLLVCNTDPHDRSGEHWIAIYVDDDGRFGEFFDSFGRPPRDLFADYMNVNCKNWIFNDKQLQSIASRFCGHFCVFYCMF